MRLSTIKHFITCAASICLALSAMAQPSQSLSINNLNIGIGIGGNLFMVPDSTNPTFALFEAPKFQGKKVASTAALWISGRNAADNNLHVAANKYINPNRDFFDGPNPMVQPSAAQAEFFKRVFKITAQQINAHRALPFPTSALNISQAINMWPAKGNAFIQQTFGVAINDELAPFVDVNNNGSYEPTEGDYPKICADEAIFFVFNDGHGQHTESYSAAFGLEIRGLAEMFKDNSTTLSKGAINNTLFVSYQIQNKSGNTYNNFNVGLFEDQDMGCYKNDRAGCDTLRELMYTYNGSNDVDCASPNGYYFPTNVAQGVKLLNRNMDVFGALSDPSSASSTEVQPQTSQQYVNVLNGRWANGMQFTYGSNGATTNNPSVVVKHLFPGNPNHANEWSEVNPQTGVYDLSEDRSMYMSANSSSITPGETKQYDYAFIFSSDVTATNLSIVDTLLRDADIIQALYDSYLAPCKAGLPVGINESSELSGVSVYPNPANNLINVQCEKTINTLVLTDILGNVLVNRHVNSINTTIDISSVAKGIYLLQLSAGKQTTTRKVVVN